MPEHDTRPDSLSPAPHNPAPHEPAPHDPAPEPTPPEVPAGLTSWRARRRWVIAIGSLFLAGLVVLGVAMARGVGDDELGEVASNIEHVPAFTLPVILTDPPPTDADGDAPEPLGEAYAITALSDQPIFLYFWASWCYPCELETPLIQRLWEEEYRETDIQFVGINILDAPRSAAEFATRHGVTFPMLHDADGDAYLEFGVNGVPDAYFIEPGLRVQRRFIGPLHEEEFRSMLDALLEASS